MDIFNNNVGIAYGQSSGFWVSVSELADGVYNKVNIGELRYLTPLDFNASPRWPAGLNGITLATLLKPTNQ